MMTKLEDYPLTVRLLAAADGGGYLCEFPDLPGCMGDGETIEDAIRDGRAALWSCVETLRDLGRPIPQPFRPEAEGFSGRWLMRVPKGLHQRLAEQARAEGVSLNTLAATLLAEGLGYRLAKGRSRRGRATIEPDRSASATDKTGRRASQPPAKVS